MSGQTIYIVLLYGVYYPERTAYKAYLDRVAERLSANERPTVVLCGSFTNPDFPQLSEAESARQYLTDAGVKADWKLEDSSLTTFENIKNAAELLKGKVDESSQYVVLADIARKAKTSWLAMNLLTRMPVKQAYELFVEYSSEAEYATDFVAPKLRVVGLEYETGELPENLSQTFSVIRDVIPLEHPELKEILLKTRRREFRLT